MANANKEAFRKDWSQETHLALFLVFQYGLWAPWELHNTGTLLETEMHQGIEA